MLPESSITPGRTTGPATQCLLQMKERQRKLSTGSYGQGSGIQHTEASPNATKTVHGTTI